MEKVLLFFNHMYFVNIFSPFLTVIRSCICILRKIQLKVMAASLFINCIIWNVTFLFVTSLSWCFTISCYYILDFLFSLATQYSGLTVISSLVEKSHLGWKQYFLNIWLFLTINIYIIIINIYSAISITRKKIKNLTLHH